MVTALTGVTSDDVRAVLDTVPDPEMPPVSVAELGMVVDVRVNTDRVEVDLVPTYSGCPATAVIREETARAVKAMEGVGSVEVRFVNTVVWEPERITAPGRRKLAEFGIATRLGSDAAADRPPPWPGRRRHGRGCRLSPVRLA